MFGGQDWIKGSGSPYQHLTAGLDFGELSRVAPRAR
jgi:hypothetical protein